MSSHIREINPERFSHLQEAEMKKPEAQGPEKEQLEKMPQGEVKSIDNGYSLEEFQPSENVILPKKLH
jgi:hypothetical protein